MDVRGGGEILLAQGGPGARIVARLQSMVEAEHGHRERGVVGGLRVQVNLDVLALRGAGHAVGVEGDECRTLRARSAATSAGSSALVSRKPIVTCCGSSMTSPFPSTRCTCVRYPAMLAAPSVVSVRRSAWVRRRRPRRSARAVNGAWYWALSQRLAAPPSTAPARSSSRSRTAVPSQPACGTGG